MDGRRTVLKKKIMIFALVVMIAGLVGCGDAAQSGLPAEDGAYSPGPAVEAPVSEDRVEEAGTYRLGSDAPAAEPTGAEPTADKLLDLFLDGSIGAVVSADYPWTFYITDLDMDSGAWDSYSVGEKVDLDNDGENELILCGPYGGIYLDARDNRIYKFAAGDGVACALSYVVYNGATWIVHSNRMNAGYESYHMEKFEGADRLVAELNFNEELVDEDDVEGEATYMLNGTEISYDEYFELCSKIFATEVNTN